MVPTMVSFARVAFALIVFGTAAAALGIVGSGPVGNEAAHSQSATLPEEADRDQRIDHLFKRWSRKAHHLAACFNSEAWFEGLFALKKVVAELFYWDAFDKKWEEFSDRLKATDKDVMIIYQMLIVVILAVVGVGYLVNCARVNADRVNAELQADLRAQDRKVADERFDIITRLLASTGALAREAIVEAEAGRTDVDVLRRDVAPVLHKKNSHVCLGLHTPPPRPGIENVRQNNQAPPIPTAGAPGLLLLAGPATPPNGTSGRTANFGERAAASVFRRLRHT